MGLKRLLMTSMQIICQSIEFINEDYETVEVKKNALAEKIERHRHETQMHT